MSAAEPYLRRIKSDFEDRGIRNEVQITEHVAFLMLIRDHWDEMRRQSAIEAGQLQQELYRDLGTEYSRLRIPQPPSTQQWARENLAPVSGLQVAFDASPHNVNWGAFFQQEIRFELLKGTSGSQYPTPHHIADLMAELALAGLNVADVFDPAAGSCGLLAACSKHKHVAGLTACDFDPQWAGIGSANLILHGAQNARYHVESALGLAHSYANHFNSVIMNPPFGGSRSASEVAEAIGTRYGRSNAAVLTALALHVLQPGGYMVVLVPSGILFGGGGEAHLRASLLQNRLEAIVTLPEDAFQPYSQVAAHLLVAGKSEPDAEPAGAVWFCALTHDGYPPGAGRDLTQEPNPNQNELPRARDLILLTRRHAWTTQLALNSVGEIQTVHLGEAGALPAVGMRLDGGDLASVGWKMVHLADGVLAKVTGETGQQLGWLYAPYSPGAVQAMRADQARTISWEAFLPAQAWAEGTAAEWQSSSDDISVTITQRGTPTLTLKRARTNFDFAAESQQPGMACLLNAQGEPLTPWLHVKEARRQKDITDDQFGTDFSAVAIEDAHGERAGWLLELQASRSENGEEVEDDAYLWIVTADKASLYPGDDNGDGAILLLESGWLRLAPQATPKLAVETSVPVKLREDVQVNGLAIGPAPAGSEGMGYSLFGVLVPRSEFVAEDGTVGDLRPSRFLPEPEAALPAHPMDVLARIRKSQTRLSTRVDSLLRTLGQPVRHDKTAEAMATVPDWLAGMLSTEQHQFWSLLCQQQVGGRPRHFNVLDVVAWCQAADPPYGEAEIAQQLQLLVRLGLVQAVHTSEYNVYRLVIVGDVIGAGETAP